ncbi:MAG: LacI family DNA-binding transcriptional regulator, partial [Pseudomonadota bacterium]
MQDVAALASVSTATVSRVVNNPTLVSSSTAERVQRAIAELGYQPNRLAQALMTRRSRILG